MIWKKTGGEVLTKPSSYRFTPDCLTRNYLRILKDLDESCRQLQILIKVYHLTLGILAQLLRSVQCHPLCSNKCHWGQAHVLPAVPISQVRSALRPLNHGLARYVWSPRSCYAPFSSSHSVPTALHRGTNTHHLIPRCSEDSSVQVPLPHDAQVHNKHLVPKESKRCFRELTELSGPMTTQRSEQECRSSKFQYVPIICPTFTTFSPLNPFRSF